MEALKHCGVDDFTRLSPSAFVRRFGGEIVLAAAGRPVLDVACGGCRNALLLASLGAKVVGIDIDLRSAYQNFKGLKGTAVQQCFDRVCLSKCDLLQDAWTYPAESLGGIINVHFLYQPLLESFVHSLGIGGILLIETIGAQGGNHRVLPPRGSLKEMIGSELSILKYIERDAGPPGSDAVTVKLVARKVHSAIR